MSHFTVTVCIKDPGQLSEVMATWNEGREVAPYRRYEEGGPASYWAVKAFREKAGLNPDDSTLTWAQVAEAHNRHWTDSEPMLVAEDGRAYSMSTYNPESKWDWYQLGGRWTDYFRYREGCGDEVMLGSPSLVSDHRAGAGSCDGGPKFALDLDALRDAKESEARETYAKFRSLVAGTPDMVPWRVLTEKITEGGYTIEDARREYRDQPRVRAIKASEDFRWYDTDDLEELARPLDSYLFRARARAVPGYATVTADGRWMAPGRMGWWGVSTDEDGDRIGYWEAANAYIESLPDDIWLIALDCHI